MDRVIGPQRRFLPHDAVIMAGATRIETAKIEKPSLEDRHMRSINPPMTQGERQYCLFMDGSKYNRNAGCKRHDNAYGVRGGGSGADRKAADRALLIHMRSNSDPLAYVAFAFTRTFGWFFFNYRSGAPWRGQLVRHLLPGY